MTYLLLCLLGIGVGALGWWLSKKVAAVGQLLMAAGLLILIGTVGWQVMSTFGLGVGPQMNRGQASVAYALANQLLRDREGRNGTVALLFPPNRSTSQAALDSFYEGYARVLTRFPSLELKEVTVELSASQLRKGDLDASVFDEVITANGDALAIVSWIGLPDRFDGASLGGDSERRPLLYIYDQTNKRNWIDLVRSKLISGAVIPREDLDEAKFDAANTPGAVFDVSHRLITTKNIDDGF